MAGSGLHPVANVAQRLLRRRAAIAVVGLGYVGLPLACCLAKHFAVIGFDIDQRKINLLNKGRDPLGEVGDEAIAESGIRFTAEPLDLGDANVAILTLPTPVDDAKRPDFTPLLAGAETIAKFTRKRPLVVIVESTVYPGATEEIVVPCLEKAGHLRLGKDLFVGYSPERINPGDTQHTINRVVKVVSGCDAGTLELVAGIYGACIETVHRAESIRVAEAAKVIENVQRDLNIALMNELAMLFHRLDIDTGDVLKAARTKWNFLDFRPGLVGGHCIGVDPWYLTHKAQSVGFHDEVILAGRRTNDGMGAFVAGECVRLLARCGRQVPGAKVLILGATFKEDVADVRNSRVADIVAELRTYGVEPLICDPVADPDLVRAAIGLDPVPMHPLPRCDGVIAAVAHQAIRKLDPHAIAVATGLPAPLLDVKSIFDRHAVAEAGLTLWRL